MDEAKLSFSMRSMFRNCPRKVYFRYVAGIIHKSEDNPARAIGRAYHRGLEAWRRSGKPIAEVYCNVEEEFVKDLTAQGLGSQDLEDEVSKLLAYLIGYVVKFNGDLQKSQWEVEFNLTTKDEVGYVDALYIEDGKAWIVEDKTRAILSQDRAVILAIDEQLLTYALLLKANGYDLGGVVYREILKTRCRRRNRESAGEFSKRLIEEYTVKGEDKYREIRIELDPAEIERYQTEKYLTDTVIRNNFKLPKEMKYWPRNTDSCIGIYGTCDYYKVCTSASNPNPSELSKHFEKGSKPSMDGGAFIKKFLGDNQ